MDQPLAGPQASAEQLSSILASLDNRQRHASLVIGAERWSSTQARRAARALRGGDATSDTPFAPVHSLGNCIVAFARVRTWDDDDTPRRGIGERAARLMRAGTGSPPWIVVTQPATGRTQLLDELRSGTAALSTFIAIGGPPRVVLAEDATLVSLLMQDERATALLIGLLEPLKPDSPRGQIAIRTLQTYLNEGLQIGATAIRLRVHRHTVRYRIMSIERRIGRSLNLLTDRMLVEAALIARELQRPHRQPDTNPP